MRLRWLAAFVWLGAAAFTTFFASQLLSADLKTAIDDRSSLTVRAKLLSEPVQDSKQLGSEPRYRAQIEILEPKGLAGSKGVLAGNEKLSDLHEGNSFIGSVSFRPAFGFASDFSANLRYVRSVEKTEQTDPIRQVRKTFLANLAGVTPDSAALVAGLAIGDDSQLSKETKDNFKTITMSLL